MSDPALFRENFPQRVGEPERRYCEVAGCNGTRECPNVFLDTAESIERRCRPKWLNAGGSRGRLYLRSRTLILAASTAVLAWLALAFLIYLM